MGFEQALSGLTGAAQNLDVIGNNVANASTVGFKEARAQFADMYASMLGGSGSNQVGIGTQVAAIAEQFTQGNISTTGNPLDVAINGGGFFRELSNGAVTYSRDGQFSLDASGFIVNSSGAQITGYPASAAGQISNAPPVSLQLSQAPVSPKATTDVNVVLNLDSAATVPPTSPFSAADANTYNSSTSVTVYDSLGNPQTLSLYFVKAGPNAWNAYATDGTGATQAFSTAVPPAVSAPIAFGTNGALSSGPSLGNITLNPPGAAALTMAISLAPPIGSTSTAVTTQYGVPFAVSSNNQDGYTTGELAGYSIAKDGTISGRYTNGQTRALGQICLANFVNPQGLVAQGGNQFVQSAASGAPVVGTASSGTFGTLQSGALEQSTVDLTKELVNMITAQRVYQANAETVKTQDQVQQTLMNLR
jgi:flagellar hook protein FlgE